MRGAAENASRPACPDRGRKIARRALGYSWAIPLLVLSAQAAAAQPVPRCSVVDRPIATRVRDLPAGVAAALPHAMADVGHPFNASDILDRANPSARLVCGYPVADGYVVEHERGGRAYNVATIRFRKTAKGYVAEPGS